MKIKNPRNITNRIVYTVLAVILICAIFLTTIKYAYTKAEEANFESLHVHTKEIKDNITLQMISDRENLLTIANMASSLYIGGKDYKILFDSFEPIGLIDEIGILLPDGKFLTRAGAFQVDSGGFFAEEAKKAPYVSGRVEDVTTPGKQIVRSAVPIKTGGQTVGVLYGSVRLDALKKRYMDHADNIDARLYLIDRTNGDFIVDTWADELGNLNNSKVLENKDGYSYDEMRKDIFAGNNGFCAYKSSISKVFMYSHYSKMDVGDWTIVLSVPEDIVFEEAHSTRDNLMLMFLAIIVVMSLYVAVMLVSEVRFSGIVVTASAIRKNLLGVAGDKAGVEEALRLIWKKCHGRTVFFADTVGNDFCYTSDENKKIIISGKDREYLHKEIFDYIIKKRKGSVTTLWVTECVSDWDLAKSNPKLYEFLREHGIHNLYIAAITERNDRISILGITNSKRKMETKELLKEVSICFSISVYNKDYLDQTEYEAVTDALTGVPNRVAYKRDKAEIDKNIIENFACMYIDVNELHTYNNKYGHTAGDEMLIYIANAIKEIFGAHQIYRMGGDEFLIFTTGLSKEKVQAMIDELNSKVEKNGYHISVGMNYSIKNIDTESSMREAEKKMYNEKAKYYQQKEMLRQEKNQPPETKLKFIETGDRDLDIMIKLLGGHYSGIYSVNLNTDNARRIIMPSYMNFGEREEKFSEIFKEYVTTHVHNDSQRGMFRFLNYDVLKDELENGNIPRCTYQKTSGEYHVLSVYAQGDETLWVFENA